MTQNTQFTDLKHIIETRRTLKPESMNGKIITTEDFENLTALADWAPTHGRTEPWRFFVFTGETLRNFGTMHAELYKEHALEGGFNPATFDNLLHKGDLASHLLIAVMKRGSNPKIPAVEELASAAAATQNILLGATALGIATMWNTGGMAHKQALKTYLNLDEEDVILGLIYLGYTDEPAKEGKRTIPLNEKFITLT